jgi:hypothetical protein
MKPSLPMIAIFCVSACTSPEERRHAEIMNAIEHGIRLPPGSKSLNRYARTYKYASPSRVIAFYFIPDDKHDEWFCKGAKVGGPTNGQILLACAPPDGMTPGERRWLGDKVFLPDVSDGGCTYVDVEYDLKSKAVIHAYCHGEA